MPEARQFVYDWFDTNKNGYEIIGVEWDGECFETPNGAYAYIGHADYTTYCEVISVEC